MTLTSPLPLQHLRDVSSPAAVPQLTMLVLSTFAATKAKAASKVLAKAANAKAPGVLNPARAKHREYVRDNLCGGEKQDSIWCSGLALLASPVTCSASACLLATCRPESRCCRFLTSTTGAFECRMSAKSVLPVRKSSAHRCTNFLCEARLPWL